MKSFITGINGFAGSFLAETLLAKEEKVIGLVQPGTNRENISLIKDQLQLFEYDLLDDKAIKQIMEKYQPDEVYHLAGESSVKSSFDDPCRSFTVNVIGSLKLLEVVRCSAPAAKILLVTSGEIYGESLSTGLTNENTPLQPKSPYAVSKAALDMLGRVYACSAKMNVIIARPFSHIGPRQSVNFFLPAAARQVAMIKLGMQPPVLKLGDLSVKRDFTDVRDVVQAYIGLQKYGQKGEAYNVCSGCSYLLKEVVDDLIKLAGMEITVELDPNRLRNVDLHNMTVDNKKLKQAIDWQPNITLEKSLKDILNYWLDSCRKETVPIR